VEWYRLAVLHGPFEYYLHDDFYDDDGTAGQPHIPVGDAADYPIPALEDVASDLRKLVDYAMTRWWLRGPVVDALRQHPTAVLLQEVMARGSATGDGWKRNRLHEISGAVLGRAAEQWIRSEMSGLTPADRISLLRSAALCLDRQAAIDEAVSALGELLPKQRVYHCWVLMQFRDPRLLGWIEQNVADPLLQSWGDLAAASGLDWGRVAEWLVRGRPLSLVALDGLAACRGPQPGQSRLMREMAPRLIRPATPEQIMTALHAYAERDKSPRVAKTVAFIIKNIQQICGRA
jgi:hypothetical protein